MDIKSPSNVSVFKLNQTLQKHHSYSTLKQRGNDVVSTWNTRFVFVGKIEFLPPFFVKISLDLS